MRVALAFVTLLGLDAALARSECNSTDRVHEVLFVDADIAPSRDAFDRFKTYLNKIAMPAGECIRAAAYWARVEAECARDSPTDAVCIDHDLAAYRGPQPEIITAGSEIVARAESRRFPSAAILFVVWMDPVAAGLVRRLSAPGGRMTGVWGTAAVTSKQIELLHLGFPTVRHVGIAADVDTETPDSVSGFRKEAKVAYGIDLDYVFANDLEALKKGIGARDSQPFDAWIVNYGLLAFDDPQGLMRAIGGGNRPVATDQVDLLKAGALFAYVPKSESVVKTWSDMIRLILGGTSVGTIPVQQPRFFNMILNATKAKSYRLPAPFLRRVTEVERP